MSCQIKMAVVQAIFEEGVQSTASRVEEEFLGNQAADLISKEFQKLAGSCLRKIPTSWCKFGPWWRGSWQTSEG